LRESCIVQRRGRPAKADATFEVIMSKPAADTRSNMVALSEQQLDNVVGGTKKVDKSSAKLFQACATGEHIKTATLVCRAG
jgi:type VI protein secretion system component Hcp